MSGIRQRHGTRCTRKGRCACPWQAEVYSNRDRRKVRKLFPTQAAAKAWRTDTLAAAQRGELRAPTTTTVGEALNALLVGARDGTIPASGGGRFKPATIRGYQVGITKRLLPAFGVRRLSDLRRADVQEFADRLTAEGLSASTVQNTLDPLRVAYRRAIRREEVTIDPTKGLELRRPNGRRERIASPSEAAELLAALDDVDRALWATAFYAGLRRGELRALRWSDIDLPGRVIHVRRGWDNIEGEQEGKSAAAKRRVPILDPLVRELAAQKLCTNRGGGDLVFGLDAHRPFALESLRRRTLAAWDAENERRTARAVELLAPITLHEARHTCASLLIAAGVNAKALSTIMGHTSIGLTFDTYGHLMPGGLDEAAAAANAYLARRQPNPTLRAAG